MKTTSYKNLWFQLKSYVSLNIENAKLTVAEKVTILVTATAISIVAVLFAVIVLFFLSVALASLLETVMSTFWAYMIIAGVYALVFAILFILRKPLIMNPVARFITRIFFS